MTQQANSATDNLTTADQLLNCCLPDPYVEVEGGSEPHGEYWSWASKFSVTEPTIDDIFRQLFDDEVQFGPDPGSMAQTEDMNSNWESSSTAMSSLGDEEGDTNANELPQQFNSHENSQRDAEEEVWCVEPNPSHLDKADQASNERIQKGSNPPQKKAKSKLEQAGTSAEAYIGKKRKGREPKILTKEQKDERMNKKREADKKYRKDIRTELNELRRMKPLYEKLMERVSRLGGIDQIESEIYHSNDMNSELLRLREKEVDDDMLRPLIETEFRRLERMKSKFVGIEEVESRLERFKEMEDESYRFKLMKSKYGESEELESKLEKFKEMEAELRRFDQIKLTFGGIDEIESGINRLKKIELQFEKHKQMLNQKELESVQASPGGSLQESPVSPQCGISLNPSAAVSGTTPDMQYSDLLVDQLIASLTDDNVGSNLDHDSFKVLLEGESESVGKYKIPQSLVSTARDIFKAHDDIAKTCKYSVHTVQTIFVLFCAAIKEMRDLSLEEVTETIIWKWRDAIMDAKRGEFDVEFAVKHLKTIVQGYFGLKARKDHDGLEQRMVSLRTDEEALRKELEKKSSEIKAAEDKQKDLTSEKCKICQESADKFLGKTVGIF